MRKYTFLLATLCLLFTWSCQKENLAPAPEINDESNYLQLNTVEDLENFEKMIGSEESATSRSHHWCGNIVHVNRGSKNAIQHAVKEAGRYGLVILEKGDHYQDGAVLIEHPVYILGRKGATVISDSSPAEEVGVVQPLFHINNTSRVTIWGVTMQAKKSGGGTGVLVENSKRIAISKNTFNNFQAGIMLEHGDRTLMWRNTIAVSPIGLNDGGVSIGFGITVINGDHARAINNKITNAVFGIWACDRNGVAQHNEIYNSIIGLILCNVPPASIPLSSGATGSQEPGNHWFAQDNYCHDNFDVGYLVIDGANNNKLINNRGGNNARVDMELTMDTHRFGFLTPKSYENFVDARSYQDLTIKDCGENNRIKGGVQIDTSARPCF